MNLPVFLRKRVTGQYYSTANEWSEAVSTARDFDTVENATAFARIQKLVNIEIVLHSDDPVCDLVLPLRQEP